MPNDPVSTGVKWNKNEWTKGACKVSLETLADNWSTEINGGSIPMVILTVEVTYAAKLTVNGIDIIVSVFAGTYIILDVSTVQ